MHNDGNVWCNGWRGRGEEEMKVKGTSKYLNGSGSVQSIIFFFCISTLHSPGNFSGKSCVCSERCALGLDLDTKQSE